MYIAQSDLIQGNFHSRRRRGITQTIADFIVGFVRDTAKRRRLRRDHEHLMELPDYLLRDIGLTRQDVQKAGQRWF